MDYGALLTRAWNIIWEHKFLILLGVLVALGSGGGGGSGANANFRFDGGPRDVPRGPDMPRIPELPRMPDVRGLLPAVAGLAVIVIIALIFVAIVLWIISTIARGGLIAGANDVDAGRATSFSVAWNAGWGKGWRLLGIGILPAIPAFFLTAMVLVFGLAAGGLAYLTGQEFRPPLNLGIAGFGVIMVGLACILVPLALILGLLRTFANRACMLEDLGVFASYRRGLQVLLENLGPAIVLFLIQIAISIALGIIGLVPGLVAALCCILWPLLLLVQGAIAAYFSTLWTLAWRRWTGRSEFGIEESALSTTLE